MGEIVSFVSVVKNFGRKLLKINQLRRKQY